MNMKMRGPTAPMTEQQQASAEVPEWARARREAQAKLDEAFAAMEAAIQRIQGILAAHEQPPVDPLAEVIEQAQEEGVCIAEAVRLAFPGIDKLARVTVAKGGE